ncbi:MAG: hypothetical protein HY070_07160 [Chloroflexi bacterium]|nr:hypothetical protein [Chloroflexota bacterium]MBI3740319.1 hypothetical protein [Chloroflexota bacterium]
MKPKKNLESKLKTKKSRAIKERAAQYKTRVRTRERTVRYPPIPIKPEEWEKYPGEYFVFFKDQILGHGHDLDRILETIEKDFGKTQEQVTLFKVPMARHKIL